MKVPDCINGFIRKPVCVLAEMMAIYILGLAATFVFWEDWTARQTGAVVLTGLAIIWYTWETMLLRQLAVRQHDQQLRPFIVFNGNVNGYFLENIGGSPALGVSIKRIDMQAPNFYLSISFPRPVPLIRAGETSPIETEVIVNGEPVPTLFAAHLDPRYAVEDVTVHISFRSIEGKMYSLSQVTSPGTHTIKGFSENIEG